MKGILAVSDEDQKKLDRACAWMMSERAATNAPIAQAQYTTISDFYIPREMHMAFFIDIAADKLYCRTYVYASGAVSYEEIENPHELINESGETQAIAWVLLRTGEQLAEEG